MFAGVLARLALVRGELHAAGLAAAADQHLRLDDDRVADLVGRRDRVLDGGHRLARETFNPWRANSCLPWYSNRSIAARDSNANEAHRAQGRRARHNARPMPIPKNVTFVTFDVYGTLIDWETGIYEAFAKEAAARRLRDRPRRS